MLFEEIAGSTMAICDNFGYPYRLMASEKSASYNDVSEFKKMLYQDSTIPEAESIHSQWDAAFKAHEYGFRFEKDFSHVAVLQEDKIKKGEARFKLNQALLIEWQNNIITWNQWQIALENDPVSDMDIYYSDMVQQGKIFGSQPNVPKEQGANLNQDNAQPAN